MQNTISWAVINIYSQKTQFTQYCQVKKKVAKKGDDIERKTEGGGGREGILGNSV